MSEVVAGWAYLMTVAASSTLTTRGGTLLGSSTQARGSGALLDPSSQNAGEGSPLAAVSLVPMDATRETFMIALLEAPVIPTKERISYGREAFDF